MSAPTDYAGLADALTFGAGRPKAALLRAVVAALRHAAQERKALQRIADWTDCECEHDENCCAKLPDIEYHCPGCIAAAVLIATGGK